MAIQTENQIKAEASRLFVMAMKATCSENRDRILFARWALLAVMKERLQLSTCELIHYPDGIEILAGGGMISMQFYEYEKWLSDRKSRYISASTKRLWGWVKNLKPAALTRKGWPPPKRPIDFPPC